MALRAGKDRRHENLPITNETAVQERICRPGLLHKKKGGEGGTRGGTVRKRGFQGSFPHRGGGEKQGGGKRGAGFIYRWNEFEATIGSQYREQKTMEGKRVACPHFLRNG